MAKSLLFGKQDHKNIGLATVSERQHRVVVEPSLARETASRPVILHVYT